MFSVDIASKTAGALRFLALVWCSLNCRFQASSSEHWTNFKMEGHGSFFCESTTCSFVSCPSKLNLQCGVLWPNDSLSVPVWLINRQETGCAKHAKKGRKMYHRGRCKIYVPLQLSSFPKHQWSPSRSASCRSPAVLLATSQQKRDWNCHRIDRANDWCIYLSMSAFKENLVHQTRRAFGVCT